MESRIKCVFNLLLVFLYFSSLEEVYSQKAFSPGILIKQQGDTLNGLISEASKSNSKECLFKTNEKAPVVQYTPDQVKAYFIEDRKYFSAYPIPKANGEKDVVFVEWLIEGGTSLLKAGNSYYLVSLDNTIQSIPVPSNRKNISATDSRRERVQWLTFLQQFSGDCIAVNDYLRNANNLDGGERSVMEIVKLYNDCQSTLYVEYSKELPRFSVGIGIMASYENTNLAFARSPKSPISSPTNPYDQLIGLDYTSFVPSFGLHFSVRNLRKLNNFSLIAEPSIRIYEFQEDNVIDFDDFFVDEIYSNSIVNWIGVGTPILLGYNIPNLPVKLSLRSGIYVELMYKSEVALVEEVVIPDRETITTNLLTPFTINNNGRSGFIGEFVLGNNSKKLWSGLEIIVGYQQIGNIVQREQPLKSSTNSAYLKAVWLIKS